MGALTVIASAEGSGEFWGEGSRFTALRSGGDCEQDDLDGARQEQAAAGW